MEQVVDLALPEYFERISAEATFQEQLSVIDMDNSRRSPVQVKKLSDTFERLFPHLCSFRRNYNRNKLFIAYTEKEHGDAGVSG